MLEKNNWFVYEVKNLELYGDIFSYLMIILTIIHVIHSYLFFVKKFSSSPHKKEKNHKKFKN